MNFDEQLQIEIKNSKSKWNTNFIAYKELNSLDIKQIFATEHEINLKRDEKGIPIPGTGRKITNEEKKMVFDYLLEKEYPLTRKLYEFILHGYINGYVDIKSNVSRKL